MPTLLAGLDGRIHLRDLALADQVADRRRADHDLVRGDAAAADPVFSSVCEITARSDSDSIERTMSFSAAGNTSMMRSMVLAARDWCAACRTPGGRFRRRSAPGGWSRGRAFRRPGCTSGSSRSAERSASVKPSVSRCDLALVDQAASCDSCTNSIGSSIVRMWPYSVVVAVVDHRRQRGRLARAGRAGHQHQAARLHATGRGRSSARSRSSSDRIFDGIVAEHGAGAAVLVEGVDAEARQASGSRTRSRISRNSSYVLRCLSFMMSYTMRVHFLVRPAAAC